ncbi:MAG: hypothetical protein ACPG1A_16680, partial [Halioglobus sp.]
MGRSVTLKESNFVRPPLVLSSPPASRIMPITCENVSSISWRFPPVSGDEGAYVDQVSITGSGLLVVSAFSSTATGQVLNLELEVDGVSVWERTGVTGMSDPSTGWEG